MLDRVFVAMSLRRDHDDRTCVDLGRRELGTVGELGPPPEHLGEIAQRVRHRRATDDHEVRRRHHGLDVDLERPVALARERDDGHALGHVSEQLGVAEQQQARLAVDDRALRLSDHGRLRARTADPPEDLPIGGDEGPRALLPRRGALSPDNGREGAVLPALSELSGSGHDLPAVSHPAPQSSDRTGGAPDTS